MEKEGDAATKIQTLTCASVAPLSWSSSLPVSHPLELRARGNVGAVGVDMLYPKGKKSGEKSYKWQVRRGFSPEARSPQVNTFSSAAFHCPFAGPPELDRHGTRGLPGSVVELRLPSMNQGCHPGWLPGSEAVPGSHPGWQPLVHGGPGELLRRRPGSLGRRDGRGPEHFGGTCAVSMGNGTQRSKVFGNGDRAREGTHAELRASRDSG